MFTLTGKRKVARTCKCGCFSLNVILRSVTAWAIQQNAIDNAWMQKTRTAFVSASFCYESVHFVPFFAGVSEHMIAIQPSAGADTLKTCTVKSKPIFRLLSQLSRLFVSVSFIFSCPPLCSPLFNHPRIPPFFSA